MKGLTIIAQGDCAEFREKRFSLNLSRALSATSHISENAHFTTVQIVERFSGTKFEKEKNLIGVNIVKFYVYSKLSLILWEKRNNGLHLVFHFSFFLFIIPSSVLK